MAFSQRNLLTNTAALKHPARRWSPGDPTDPSGRRVSPCSAPRRRSVPVKLRVLLPAVLAFCVAAFAVPAKSDTLWDQSSIDLTGGYFNSISGSPPFGLTNYLVNDVTVSASGWTVQSITVRFSGISATWGGG